MVCSLLCTFLSWIVYTIGIIAVLRLIALGVFKLIGELKGVNFKKLGANNGGWAVITGASDGIGKAYAFELAKRGFNIFLISRTLSKLNAVAEEIENKYKVETRVKSVDFFKAGDAEFDEIQAEIDELGQVGILVNNVGTNYPFPSKLLDQDAETDSNIVNVNITVQNKMTRIVLPKMKEQKAGAIIFLSSTSGRVPVPMLAVYSGTKAYNDFFSQALYQEYVSDGIVTQSVTPGVVVSNMSKTRREHAGLLIALPEPVVARSINRLGKDIEISPHYPHAIFNFLLSVFLPRRFSLSFLKSQSEGIRKRALRKQNQQKKD